MHLLLSRDLRGSGYFLLYFSPILPFGCTLSTFPTITREAGVQKELRLEGKYTAERRARWEGKRTELKKVFLVLFSPTQLSRIKF